MIVHDELKWAGYLPPKTGACSVSRTLKRMFPEKVTTEQDLHLSVPLIDRLDHFHFVTVRNPFPRAVSYWWHYKTRTRDPWPSENRARTYAVCRHLTFRQFLDRPDTRRLLVPCSHWLDVMTRCDAVLRTETLASDFLRLPFILGGWRLSHENQGAYAGDWRDHYDDWCEGVVIERMGEDFERLGYPATL